MNETVELLKKKTEAGRLKWSGDNLADGGSYLAAAVGLSPEDGATVTLATFNDGRMRLTVQGQRMKMDLAPEQADLHALKALITKDLMARFVRDLTEL